MSVWSFSVGLNSGCGDRVPALPTDGGRNPSFNETIKLALIEGLREVNASVWNSNTIERDDYIGSTK